MRHADSTRRTGPARFLATAVALAVLAAAGAGQAQLSAKKGPLDITGDQTEVRDAEHLMIWRGKVEALQDGDRMRADLLHIYYKSAPKAAGAPKTANLPGADFGDIDHMEASGNVYFVTATQVARGDKAVYTASNQTIVITGDVVLTQGESVLRGSRLVVDLATNHSTMDGGVNGRPRAVFYQDKTAQGKKH